MIDLKEMKEIAEKGGDMSMDKLEKEKLKSSTTRKARNFTLADESSCSCKVTPAENTTFRGLGLITKQR